MVNTNIKNVIWSLASLGAMFAMSVQAQEQVLENVERQAPENVQEQRQVQNQERTSDMRDCGGLLSDDPFELKNVYVNFAINDLRNIDSYENTFYVDFYLRLKWPRPEGNCFIDKSLGSTCWQPKIEFFNAIDLNRKTPEDYDPISIDDSDCRYVIMDNRYAGTFFSEMDLHKFPHDKHTLSIILEDYDKESKELRFVYENRNPDDGERIYIDRDMAYEGEDPSLPEWDIRTISVAENKHEYEFFENTFYSRFTIDVEVKRFSNYYNIKLISVCLMITVISWMVFFISPANLQGRTSISASALLALVAHNYVANSILPRISYQTSLDFLLVNAQILVFSSAIVNLFSYIAYNYGKNKKPSHPAVEKTMPIPGTDVEELAPGPRVARYIDWSARVIFPLCLILFVALYVWDMYA